MNLKVKRHYEPIFCSSEYPWEQTPFDRTVWEWEDGSTLSVKPKCLPHFVPGLLRCYVDDEKVTLQQFVEALDKIGFTLKNVETAL